MTYSLKKLPFLTFASAIFSLCIAIPSQSATVSYNLSGMVTSGPLLNQTYSGNFSFDNAGLTGSGDEFLTVNSILFNFDGTTFTELDATATPEVAFSNGNFLGLSFVATRPAPSLSFSLIPGTFDVTEAFLTYQQGAFSGDGNITYTSTVTTPESSSVIGLFAIGVYGLGTLHKFVKTRIYR